MMRIVAVAGLAVMLLAGLAVKADEPQAIGEARDLVKLLSDQAGAQRVQLKRTEESLERAKGLVRKLEGVENEEKRRLQARLAKARKLARPGDILIRTLERQLAAMEQQKPK